MPDRSELVALALEVAARAPSSRAEVDRLEQRLGPWSDAPGFEDFQTALASYSPGFLEPGLLDGPQLQFEARQFLHLLGHHSTCAHE